MKKNELVIKFNDYLSSLGYNRMVLPYSSRFARDGKELFSAVFRISSCEYYLNAGYYDGSTIYIDFCRRSLNKYYFTYYSTYYFNFTFPYVNFIDLENKVKSDFFSVRRYLSRFISGVSND